MSSKHHSEVAEDRKSLRISDSPRRLPLVMQAASIPARKVRLEEDGEAASHRSDPREFVPRTSDFFDVPSDDEFVTGTSLEDLGLESDIVSQHKISCVRAKPGSENQQPIADGELGNGGVDLEESQTIPEDIASGPQEHAVGTPHSSFDGSIEEILLTRQPRRSQSPKLANETTLESSGNQLQETDERSPTVSTKTEQILGAHLLAHEITLHALMRDEDVIDKGLSSIAAVHGTNFRSSLLPPSLRITESRNRDNEIIPIPQRSSKRVQVVPPPIDISRPHSSLPDDFVPTPYPYEIRQSYPKALGRAGASSDGSATPHQRHLLVRVLSNNSNIPPKSTYVTIPPSNHFTIPRRSRHAQNPPHPTPSFFDDEDLFHQLRQTFQHLSGGRGLRHFSARALCSIRVNGGLSRGNRLGARSSHCSSQGNLSSPSLSIRDRLVSDNLLRHFHHPRTGRARYKVVKWAYRLAAQKSPTSSRFSEAERTDADADAEKDGQDELHEGEPAASLDFVVDWSVTRILFALGLVITLSVLAALLWIFLGKNTPASLHAQGGFRDAGDRVAAGALVGIFVLGIGMSGFAGWVGVSWLVM